MSISVSWDEIDLAVNRLYRNLIQGFIFPDSDIKIIYALGRGGLVPARLLSGHLYQKRVGFIDPNRPFKVLRKSIICDDILDTGQTYQKVRQKSPPNQLFAFLFLRKNKVPYDPNVFYGTFIDHQKYLVFPWERGMTD